MQSPLDQRKDHRRLISDTAEYMRCTYFTAIFCALAYKITDKAEIQSASDEAQIFLDRFMESGLVPDYIEDFCIDVLLGKIPVKDSKGRAFPKWKGNTHVT